MMTATCLGKHRISQGIGHRETILEWKALLSSTKRFDGEHLKDHVFQPLELLKWQLPDLTGRSLS